MKLKIFVALYILLNVASVFAQNVKQPDSYNYQHGVEALKKGDNQEALIYLNKDIEENPENGYSFAMIAIIRYAEKEYGKALTAVEEAIKYLPKEDVEFSAFSYSLRGDIYKDLGDTVKTLNDYASAMRINPNESNLYEKRAQIYFEQGKYQFADEDYRKMTELTPGYLVGYMGLGRNALEQRRWDDAISQFSYVVKLDGDYSSGYSFRAEAELKKGMWDEATRDLISAIQCGWDDKAESLIWRLEEPAFAMMLSKLKVQAAKAPEDFEWPCLLGIMYERDKQYIKAIEFYKEACKKNAIAAIYRNISFCYIRLGAFEEAMSNIDQAISLNSMDCSSIARKANIYYCKGDIDSAISEINKALSVSPDYSFGYWRRALYKSAENDWDGAIEDASMSIAIDPNNSLSYSFRGFAYQRQGKKELAEADYKKVVELENKPERYFFVPYAYLGLGQNDKAVAAMDTAIARSEDKAEVYYNAACLYSRMKDKENALKLLEQSLKCGYVCFAHIDCDCDMDFVRETDEFKALISKYKMLLDENLKSIRTTSSSGEATMPEEHYKGESRRL